MDLLSLAIIIALAFLPLSLIIIKVFSSQNLKLAYTTRILTSIRNVLTKDYGIVKSILLDKYKISLKENKKMVDILNYDNNEIMSVDKDHLRKDQILKLISVITLYTNFSKAEKTESVIKNFFNGLRLGIQKFKNDYKLIAKIPTTIEKKLSTSVVKKIDTKEVFALSKGHPKKILEKCTRIIINNEKVELTEKIKRKLRKRIKVLNQKGQKITAFAYKGLPYKILDKYTENFTEQDLIFLGLIGTATPLNLKAKKHIQELKDKGIKINVATKIKERNAVAIAKEFNLINPQYFEVITGKYLRTLSKQKIEKMLQNTEKDFLFAELQQKDKALLEEVLRDMEENVVTIKKRNPQSLINLIEGIFRARSVISNFEKIFFHSLSCKIAQIILIAFALILKAPLPFTISSILIIDLVINLLNEIALRETESKEISNADLNKKIFSRPFIKNTLIHGVTLGLIGLCLLTWNSLRLGWEPGEALPPQEMISLSSVSLILVLFIIFQTNKAFETIKYKLKNIYLIFTGIISLLLAYSLTSIQLFQNIFNLTELRKIEWEIIAYIFVSYIIIKFLIKNALKITKNRVSED
ncbi:hypothetical protein GF354_02450 [Candidatus Peregrinibacteria bacterium]|nr:hypothetical protein [Candidatus Peregrinibacteria bacterium]